MVMYIFSHINNKNYLCYSLVAKRYCSMLIREGGVEILKYLENMHTEQTTKPNLQSLCRSILETLKLNVTNS